MHIELQVFGNVQFSQKSMLEGHGFSAENISLFPWSTAMAKRHIELYFCPFSLLSAETFNLMKEFILAI